MGAKIHDQLTLQNYEPEFGEMNVAYALEENILSFHTVPKSVLSSIATWTAAYFFIKKLTGKHPEWVVRLVTAIHATLITILSILAWSCFREWNIEKLGQTNSKYEEAVLCLTLGYFIFDVTWIIVYKTEGPTMYFHHSASILCLAVILGKGSSAFEVLVGVSGLELTNPCLQARWFLRTYGYQGTWLYTIVEISFMITFITFRIFYGSYLTWNIIIHPKCHFTLKAGTISLYLVSWLFALQMFSYISKRYKKKR